MTDTERGKDVNKLPSLHYGNQAGLFFSGNLSIPSLSGHISQFDAYVSKVNTASTGASQIFIYYVIIF